MESNSDRFNAIGAWNYSIPPDASPVTVDWDTFLGNAPKRPFDATRFFRWRNYRDYGTGVAGDLFIHLLTSTHYVTNSLGPTRIFSSGGLYHWKDGRDVPDVLVSVMDYPQTATHGSFQAVYRVNFANAGTINNSTRIIGDEGEILFGNGRITLTKKKLPVAPGYGNYDSFFTFPEETQKEFVKQYDAKYPEDTRKAEPAKEIKFESPKGEDAHALHFLNFFDNIRKGSQGTLEDPVMGFRAAGPALRLEIANAYADTGESWAARRTARELLKEEAVLPVQLRLAVAQVLEETGDDEGALLLIGTMEGADRLAPATSATPVTASPTGVTVVMKSPERSRATGAFSTGGTQRKSLPWAMR
jgi:hypothetical protein